MTRLSMACLCVGLAAPISASASVDICSDPRMQSRLSFEFVSFEESSFDEVDGTAELRYNNYDLLFSTASEKYLFGAAHRYNKFDVNTIQPETNGHLHTLFFPFHVVSGDDGRNFRFSVAPAISGSSNVTNRPDEYTSDAVQILAAFVWGRRIDETVGLRIGICGDHRFGKYQVYPAASVLWQPHPRWNIQLGFPNSKLAYQISGSWSSEIRIAPDGNQWYVLDDSRTSSSQFVYEAYAIDWSINWQFLERYMVTASVGQQLHNRYEFTLLDQSRVRLSGDSFSRIGFALEWQF